MGYGSVVKIATFLKIDWLFLQIKISSSNTTSLHFSYQKPRRGRILSNLSKWRGNPISYYPGITRMEPLDLSLENMQASDIREQDRTVTAK
jgi:hypothetical protein